MRCREDTLSELTIDPDRDSYQGTVRIDVDLIRPASTLWLNAAGLTVWEATAQAAADLDATNKSGGG